MKRAVVIYNPLAGSGRAEEFAGKAANLLARAGWNVESIATRDRSGATAIAQQVAPRVDRIVVLGGDGSLREAIAGLGAETARVEVGFIPVGNANVVARELGISLEPEEAVRALADAVPTEIDVGLSNGELFVAVVGIGWDALTVHYLDRIRHSRFGRVWYRLWSDSAYVVAGILAALRDRARHFPIVVDGDRLAGEFCAAHFCNLRTYSKGWSLTPDASGQSGALHYQARKRRALPFLVWHLLAAILRRKVPAFISVYGAGSRLVVEAAEPLHVQVDGDYRGTTRRLELAVCPAAVRMLVPRDAAAAFASTPGDSAPRRSALLP